MNARENAVPIEQSEAERKTDHLPLKGWLQELSSQGGSDLLLVPQAPPAIRVEAVLHAISDRALSGEEIEAAILPAMAAHAREEYQQYGICDSSYRVDGLGRFRINLHRERGRPAAAIRALPSKVPH